MRVSFCLDPSLRHGGRARGVSSEPIKQVFSVVTDFYSQAEGGVWQADSVRLCGGGFCRAVVTHDHKKLA